MSRKPEILLDKKNALHLQLDQLYEDGKNSRYIDNDPIEIPRSYSDPLDIETAGLIASALSYGRVSQFKPVIKEMLSTAGSSPYRYVKELDIDYEIKRLSHSGYRFSKGVDLAAFLYIIKNILHQHGSIGALFTKYYNSLGETANIRKVLDYLVDFMLSVDTTLIYGNNRKPRGLTSLMPSPARGSACKRLNMYLRWMVRGDDGIDFGLWKIPGNKLVIPLDTHTAFICRSLGLTSRKAGSWVTAAEITENLRQFDAADPVKYDFALSHLGISDNCGHKETPACSSCRIAAYCTLRTGE